MATGVFKDALEKWAAGLLSGQVTAELMNGANSEQDSKALDELKFQLMDTHYYWVKMTIPDYCIIGMTELAPSALQLIFDTLDICCPDGSAKTQRPTED